MTGRTVIPVYFAILLTLGDLACSETTIREEIREGKKIIVMDNELITTVLVPEIARLPLSYFFKLTGHEEFIHPVPLHTPSEGFVFYGGIIDAIPWVSGKVGDKRLPDKGYLYSSPWEYKTGQDEHSVWFVGSTSFDYDDPITRQTARIFFQKRITGYDNSTQLKMDYLIRNTGVVDAKFTFSAHSRTGVSLWDEGDYIPNGFSP
jgi:hypothetical protein